ncbi:MAG: glycosyltransferase family 2 protein [Candidatus Limnocylindrales bacterium]
MAMDRQAGRRGSVSAIVPVYNEAKTVARVVETLLGCPHIDEVICVDDGSTDASPAILRCFGPAIRRIELPANCGKGAALAAGIRIAGSPVVAFFDADLTNLSNDHIAALLAPIRAGTARAVLAYGTGDTTVSLLLSPWIGARFTGERAYLRADLLPQLERMAETRFGVEVFLNGLFPKQETAVVRLDGLVGLGKEAKHPPLVAAREYIGEAAEVTREILRSMRA